VSRSGAYANMPRSIRFAQGFERAHLSASLNFG
jgi:hypothetical protein